MSRSNLGNEREAERVSASERLLFSSLRDHCSSYASILALSSIPFAGVLSQKIRVDGEVQRVRTKSYSHTSLITAESPPRKPRRRLAAIMNYTVYAMCTRFLLFINRTSPCLCEKMARDASAASLDSFQRHGAASGLAPGFGLGDGSLSF